LISYKSELDGSISIFFAMIILVLISFLLTIYDHTRLQMMQAEAYSNYQVAANQALSQYDPVLFQEYGLFAGAQGARVEQLVDERLSTMFYPTTAKKHDYIMDYFLSESNKPPDFMIMEPESYSYQIEYIPYLDETLKYPKSQIIDYMQQREPYLLFSQIYDHLEIFSKTTKTSTIIEDKNNLIAELDSIADYKKKLFLLIDGIELFDNGNWTFNKASSYIRNFSYGNSLNYDYFPEGLRNQFDQEVLYYDDFSQTLIADLDKIDLVIDKLLTGNPFNELSVIDIEGNEQIFYIPQPIIQETLDELNVFDSRIKTYIESYTKILELVDIHREALIVLEEFENSCVTNVNTITEFQDGNMNDEQLVQSVIEQVNTELSGLKSEMTVNEINYNAVDNLLLVKEQLENNLSSLTNSISYIEVMNDNLNGYIYKRFVSKLDNYYFHQKEKRILFDSMSGYKDKNSENLETVEKSTIINLELYISSFLHEYQSDILFDYSMINEAKPEENIYEDKKNDIEGSNVFGGILEGELLNFSPDIKINEAVLPSHMYSGIHESDITTDGNLDFDNIRSDVETRLINEYIVQMFGNVSKSLDPNGKSLNGFNVNEHFLNYEAEYIIGGTLNEKKNVDTVLGYIYGMRIMLNSIHLLMDNSKRTTIMNIATTIAGWWTGGVGAIVIAIIIGALWAILESVADVFLLVSNEKVPIIKTQATWYTSLDGNLDEIFNAGIRRLEDEATMLYEDTKIIVKDNITNFRSKLDVYKETLSEETWKLIEGDVEEFENTLLEHGMEIDIQKEMFGNEVHNDISNYLDLCITAYMNNGGSKYEYPELVCLAEVEEVATNMATRCIEQISKLDENDRTLTNMINIKSQVIEDYEETTLSVISKNTQNLSNVFEGVLENQIEGLLMIVEDNLDNQVKLGKKVFYEAADQVKDEYLEEILENKKGKDFTSYLIPSFSYEAYLMILLSMPIVDNETKVGRIMDLIQMNVQKKYDDYSINLSDYYVGVNISGFVVSETLFATNISKGKLSKYWELGVWDVQRTY